MKVKLLLLEGVEKEIDEDVKNQLGQEESVSDYEKLVAELEGKNISKDYPTTIYVDMTKYYKITNFSFKKTDVKGLFMSTKEVKDQKVMVIIIEGQEYDCLFDEAIFEELENYLNN